MEQLLRTALNELAPKLDNNLCGAVGTGLVSAVVAAL
jgi:hypothetical protein